MGIKQSAMGILNLWQRNTHNVTNLQEITRQCINIIKTTEVQKANIEPDLKVYRRIFDIHTGILINLKINFDEILKDIKENYKIAT